jgi:hypothetical protein
MLQREAPAIGGNLFKAATIEKADGERRVRFVASDESVDRMGDIIRASGWDLTGFRKTGGPLLFGHNSSMPPIGRVPEIKVEGTRLVAEAEFLPKGVSPFADMVSEMVRLDFMRNASVGFFPTVQPKMIRDEKNDRITGFEFVGQSLVELSVVPVPANENASAIRALSKSFSLDESEIAGLFASDGDADRAAIEAQRRNVNATLARLSRRG